MTRRQTLARLFADRRPRRISFIKKNGALRSMTFQYQGGPIVGALMTVWDVEEEAYRRLNLNTVTGSGLVLREAKRPLATAGVELMFS